MARLIDADPLKKDFNLNFGGVSHATAAAEIIDRQPTIDLESLRPRTHWERPSELDRQLCDLIATYGVWHTRPSPQEAARDRLFQLSMPMWVKNGRDFHE